MAVEMVDRRIRFIWNAGGGSQTIEHPLILETNDKDLLQDKMWYKIEVIRINNIATLSVQPIPDTNDEDKLMVTNNSSPFYLRMDVNASSHFFIGGVPRNKVPSEITSRSFAGCLYEAFLDGKRIGLWNFLSNKGCKGCKEGASKETDNDDAYFNGDGYAIQPQIRHFSRKRYQIRLSFKSFDEDALLFFSANAKVGHFLSIELKNGSVLFQYFIGGRSPLVIQTNKQYNTGKTVRVTAKMNGLTGVLTVDDESREAALPTGGPSNLELKTSDIYFGGVPPNFTKKNWPLVGFSPFLGCMNALQIDLTPINVFRHRVFGIEAGCKPKAIKILWLKGNGYFEMNGQTLHREANFAFSFETKDSDGLLMLSTFAGKELKSKRQLNNFYSVSLLDGNIHCWINAGGGTLRISAVDAKYNDGKFHTVSVLKSMKSIELRIDDQNIVKSKIQGSGTYAIVDSPTVGGLYFGGIPEDIEDMVTEHTPSSQPITGHIKDVVFNDRLLSFNEPVRFIDVGVGRFKPPAALNGPFMPSERMPEPMKCVEDSQVTIERRAMKFGDGQPSYSTVNGKHDALSGRYNISFEFRTYYPNGMLVLLKNERKNNPHYLVMALRNGRIEVRFRFKKEMMLPSQGKLNNGQWQKVVFSREKRNFKLTVDNKKTQELKLSGKIHVQPRLHIGGIPDKIKIPENLTVEHFKGCIRYFDMNGEKIDLAGHEVEGGGQCFAKVERGAYFAGDAYAIYARNFSVGRAMEIELEFKTTRLIGILLSVSEDGGSPALALELDNGNVTMTVDRGDKQRLSASVAFSTKYFVCDNTWHMIKASYSETSVTLKVDGQTNFGYSKGSVLEEAKTNGDLFIGGLPYDANQGVLKSRDNFVGCIRNYVIKNQRLDWTDMAKCHNVKLDSCPVEYVGK